MAGTVVVGAGLVDEGVVVDLWSVVEGDPTTEVKIDLVSKEIRTGALTAPFQLDDYTRWRLLEGLDDIGITLSHVDDIAAFEAARPFWKPSTL